MISGIWCECQLLVRPLKSPLSRPLFSCLSIRFQVERPQACRQICYGASPYMNQCQGAFLPTTLNARPVDTWHMAVRIRVPASLQTLLGRSPVGEFFKNLKDATTLDDLAAILGYKPSGLADIVYKLPDALKYKKFRFRNAAAASVKSARRWTSSRRSSSTFPMSSTPAAPRSTWRQRPPTTVTRLPKNAVHHQ